MAIQPSYNSSKSQYQEKAASAGHTAPEPPGSPSHYPTKWHQYNARVRVEMAKLLDAQRRVNEAQEDANRAVSAIANLNLPEGGL